jgi:hypothetical protein
MQNQPTPQSDARRIAPTLAEEEAERVAAEINRPWQERMENNAAHKKFDTEVLTPWQQANNQHAAEVNEALGIESNISHSMGSNLEQFLRLNIAAAQADYYAHVAAIENGTKPDLKESGQLRVQADRIITETVPSLLRRRREAREDVAKAKAAYESWLQRNPRPTPPSFVIKPSYVG